jgi:hypothetical protein
MSRKIDVPVGTRFGKLIIISESYRALRGNDSSARWWVECCCDCGVTVTVRPAALVQGKPRSCSDCGSRATIGVRTSTHHLSKAPEYAVWNAILARTLNPKTRNYVNYGGRGIKLDPSWQGDGGFQRFIADMGRRPSAEHSIDRIDNDGPYAPWNCRWATKVEQSRNHSRNVYLTLGDETLLMADWSRRTGLSRPTICKRKKRGWSDEDTLTIPLGGTR